MRDAAFAIMDAVTRFLLERQRLFTAHATNSAFTARLRSKAHLAFLPAAEAI